MQQITIIPTTLLYINVLSKNYTRNYMVYCVKNYILSHKLLELHCNIYVYYVEYYIA